MDAYQGRVALVTGAASGIGRAIAERLIRRGTKVVATDIDEGGLAEVLSASQWSGGLLSTRAVDVADSEAMQALARDVREVHGRIDFLFNNAGIGIVGEIRDLEPQHWNRIIDVNLRGVVHGVMAVYPIMIAQGSGHIVNTASSYGLLTGPGLGAYCTTKHAVVGLTLSLRSEAEAFGIKVSVLCPGYIQTRIIRGSTYVRLDADRLTSKVPFKYQSPEDCALATLRGMERNRAVITTPGYVRILWWMNRLVPSYLARINRAEARRLRRSRLEGEVLTHQPGAREG